MITARRSRRIAAPAEELWAVVSDPHHLPRWWPRVERIEDVHDGAFTEVMKTRKGKTVRADFELLRIDPDARAVCWEQIVAGTPFAAVLAASETEVQLVPHGLEALTEVTIELRQEVSGGRAVQPSQRTRFAPGRRDRFRGVNLSWGGRLVRKAATATIEEALEGLERISV
jgi:uncharacterized protein YndB with AHSA1/START domain